MSAAARRDPSEVVAQLTEIWSRILRTNTIAPDSNFFDLGGDSLQAVNLFLEIERETGIHLAITAIYDAQTLAELAELIAAEQLPHFSPLVLLKPGAHGPPFFLVHGIGGTVMELQSVGRQIDIPGPVYALQAQGLDGREPALASIHDMAACYLAAVRSVQPSGPYWLGGYSFGGLVALEMARRLGAEDEKIKLLLLLDAYARPTTWPLVSRAKMSLRRLVHYFRSAAGKPTHMAVAAFFADAVHAIRDAAARMVHSREYRHARLLQWLHDKYPDLPLPLIEVRQAGNAALASYVPQFYPGRVTFLKAERTALQFPDDPLRIWRNLVSEFVIHTVPGGHLSLVDEHAGDLARRITACISDAMSLRVIQTASAADRARKPFLESSPV